MKANERRNQIGYKQKRKPVRIGKSSRAESTWFDSYANTSLFCYLSYIISIQVV